jgi:polar amino acid transport system substrate-binding protein
VKERAHGGRLALAVFVIIGLGLGVTAGPARDIVAIRKDGVLRLATEGSTPPFNYFQNGRLIGFDVEIGDAIAGQLHLRSEWAAAPFDTLLIGLQQGRYDLVVMGQAITPERQRAGDFTVPYVCSGGVIVALPGGPRHRADLIGKTVGVQVGTTYLAALTQVDNVGAVRTFQKDTDALQNLLAHRVDAWVSDRLTALYVARQNPDFNLQVGDALFKERDGIAIAKGDSALRDAVNVAIGVILANGTYAAIAKRHFGQDVRCE